MKSYKKVLALGIVAILSITVITSLVNADEPVIVDLMAGQNYDAGQVEVSDDGEHIYVKIDTEDGWELKQTHVHVARNLEGFPNEGNNPPPGRFDYKKEHNPPVSEYTYKIKNSWDSGNVLIAVHADVCKTSLVSGGLEWVESNLPNHVTVHSTHAFGTDYDESYFEVEISGGTKLDGKYEGWCIDTEHNMNTEPYLANVYSSYKLPAGELSIEKPENIGLLNFIINQHYVGKESMCDNDPREQVELFTYGDVQKAIWSIMEDYNPDVEDLGPWEKCRVEQILSDAESEEKYKPACKDVVAIILVPKVITEDIGQTAIIEVPIPCEFQTKCETAWSAGQDFSGGNWAMYLTYEI